MNKKKIMIGSIVALAIVAGFVSAIGLPSYDVLVVAAYGVLLESGDVIDLPVDTRIGGEPTGEFVILGETREFETAEGVKVIDEGEEIWCEAEPGYPDICGGLS